MNLKESPYSTLLDNLLKILKKNCGDNLVSLILYGSIARGDYKLDSDIDLLIIFEKLPKKRLSRQKFFILLENEVSFTELNEKNYYPTFSPILKTREEARFLSPLYLDMINDAIILFDKDNFFYDVLQTLNSQLIKLGAKKKNIGKKWYWDLKPTYKFGDDIVIE